MGFLKKHYEKIILAGFLLVFIVSLVYLIAVFSQSMEITEKDLTLVRRQADYSPKFDELGQETAEEGKRQFAALKELGLPKVWLSSSSRDPESPVSSDFMTPISAARCPHCEKIIPLIYFERTENCPLCKGELKEPEKIKTDDQLKDTDGDGMPDIWELKYKLNPVDPSDRMADPDGDGFPNIIEYLEDPQTDPTDPKSRPPLAERLALAGVRRNQIPVQLANLMTNNSEDKANWLAQVQVQSPTTKRWTSEFVKVGAEIKLGADMYKIVDFIFKEEERFDRRLNQPVKTNVSEIIIQNMMKEGDKPIVVEIKKPVFENLVRIGLRDVHTEKAFTVTIGDSFQIGDAETGIEKYKVLSLDGSKSVTIQEDKPDGKQFVIGEKAILTTKIEEVGGVEKAPATPGPEGMEGFPEPGRQPPGGRKAPPRFNPDF